MASIVIALVMLGIVKQVDSIPVDQFVPPGIIDGQDRFLSGSGFSGVLPS